MKYFFLLKFCLITILTAILNGQAIENIKTHFSDEKKYTLGALSFIDENNGWATDAWGPIGDHGRIFNTTDGGYNWRIQRDIVANQFFRQLQFIDKNIGYVIGTDVIKTTDGGENWFDITPDNTTTSYMSMIFLDSLQGLVGAEDLFHTTNGGKTWEKTVLAHNDSLIVLDIYFANSDTGWIYRNNGFWGWNPHIIYRTTDTGRSWVVVGTSWDLYPTSKIRFVSFDNGFLFGETNYHTTDEGASWTLIPDTQLSRSTNIIDAILSQNGLILLYNSATFAYSSDNGISFSYYSTETDNNTHLWDIVQIPRTASYYVGGDNGTLIRINFVTEVKSEANSTKSETFQLDVYPNPFNPNTTVSFSLPANAKVKLVIYDITGREVTELTKKPYTAGMHQITFNASGFASGVYIVNTVIIPNGESGSKKMFTQKILLIK